MPSPPGYQGSDRNGTFSAQVTFRISGTYANPMAWGFKVKPALQAMATSNMNCTANQFKRGRPTGYTDTHRNIPVSYHWHSTVPRNSFAADYQLGGMYTFRVNVGGHPGTANLRRVFNYILEGDNLMRHASEETEKPYTSELVIEYDDQSANTPQG
ncbi:hypothetical protein [Carbonactinospora thermoautotrophica]|uniref:hypothetical protein n=1 Tax=Carbonactinospora thermoautotrophica TaxID=1469144 RepID=UPI00227054F8|nr:hypothetical protein [Carbonactinospora thermoautotrophica]